MASSNFLKTVDMKKLDIPKDVLSKKDSMIVSDGFKDVEGKKVFYREAAANSDVTLLLLHGKNFSSKTWLELGTIQIVAAMGYRTLAVDVPGYGNSPSASISDRCEFLRSLIASFHISKPVIVSPSLSGFFTLPFLLKYHDELAGYVPVAPVGSEVLEKVSPCNSAQDDIIKRVYEPLQKLLHPPVPNLQYIKTPTLVVFGELDRSKSSALLSLLPNSQTQEIPNGKHPAYLDNPDLWHKLLYNFLHHLSAC